MSSGETASVTDESPKASGPKVMSKLPTPISTNVRSTRTSLDGRPPSSIASPTSPISPTSHRKPIKQRANSQSVASTQINGASRTLRSVSANPSKNPPPKEQTPSTSLSRLKSTPSLQDIIKRFNDQPDEALPLPPVRGRSSSRASSRATSPVGTKHGSKSATSSTTTSSTQKKQAPAWRPAGSGSKTVGTSNRSVSSSTKIPHSMKSERERKGSASSTGSHHSRGRRASTKAVTDSTHSSTADRGSRPSSSATVAQATDSETSSNRHENSPPLTPISPIDTHSNSTKSRIPLGSGKSTQSSTTSSRTTRTESSSLAKSTSSRRTTSSRTTTGKTSPTINAYITAPAPQKSPPLRSSRPRLPVAATKNAPSKSSLSEPATSSKVSTRTRKSLDKKEKDKDKEDSRPKKKIPELGSVDFAARRKMIAVAFNDRMDREREERNRARQKKEREAAAKAAAAKKQQKAEAAEKEQKEASREKSQLSEERAANETTVIISDEQKPVGLGLDFGMSLGESGMDDSEQSNEAGYVSANEHPAETTIALGNGEIAPDMPQNRNENSTQLATHGSRRPLSVIEASPRSPKLPENPVEYKRQSSSFASPEPMEQTLRSRPESLQLAHDDLVLAKDTANSSVLPPVSPTTVPPRIQLPDTPGQSKVEQENQRRSPAPHAVSVVRESPSRRNSDWERAVEEEKSRRKQIEQDREMKLKNRLSTPVTPKISSPTFDNDATPTARNSVHKKQSSWSASPHLAPPDTLGHIMWKFRPLSTGGESMIDNFYREQEDLVLSRKRKQELMKFVEPAEPEEEEIQDVKGKGVQRNDMSNNDYPLEIENDDSLNAGGYVHIEGTYRYSASTARSSVRSRSLDPNDYWTPQPSIGDFETNPPRESWATDSTMTSYSTGSGGLAPNGAVSRKLIERDLPVSETPPTPPPKDIEFVKQMSTGRRTPNNNSNVMLPLPTNGLSARRSSTSTDTVQPLRITKPAVLHQDVYQSPISINSATSLQPESHDEDVAEHSHSPSSAYSEDDESSNPSMHTPGSAPLYLGASPNTSMITTSGSFVSGGQEAALQEKKHLTKRRYLLKELLDTEKAFFQDMTVTEEIYKGTAEACDDLKPEDVRVLFGNSNSIVAFSRGFLETLKAAIAPVYVLPKGSKTPSSSQIDIHENGGEANGLGEPSEEADLKTWVGEAFAQALPNMEKVYGDYCKNHEAAVSRLQALQKVRGIAIWLKECKHVADDLTNAWSLESLLIKPVQRLLKYPLLLDQILECTPEGHPDREAIELVAKEVRFATERINESKKRKDLMDKLVGPRKRADTDLRHGLTKGFQRRAEKLRQSVGLSEMPTDQRYEATTAKFKEQYFKLQLIMKDIEMYMNDVEKQINEFGTLALKFEEFAACSPTRFKEYEDRWQSFVRRMKEMKDVALVDHRIRVKRHVIGPIETALKMFDNPQKVMVKREKKAVDYARFCALKERGDKPDKKVIELADAYLAINDTLLDELPKLHTLIEGLVAVVLCNFAEVCGVWERQWAARLEGLLDPLDIPSNFSDIIEVYKSDFIKVEPVVESMTITNTKTSIWKTYSIHSASSTHLDSASTSSQSIHRHSNSDISPSPNPSSFSRSSFSGNSNRLSGTFASPLVAAISPALPMLPAQLAQQQSQAQRGRAVSAVHCPSPSRAPPPPPIRALSSISLTQSPTLSPTFSVSSGIAPTSNPAPNHPRLPSIHGLDTGSPSQSRPSTSSDNTGRTVLGYPVLWLCASIYSYQASKEADAKRDMGFAYLTYDQGEIFDVIGTKGEYWLARNQDDDGQEFGWIWCKHFAKLALD